jgi:hypothetical protein
MDPMFRVVLLGTRTGYPDHLVEPSVGIEPTTPALPWLCSTD